MPVSHSQKFLWVLRRPLTTVVIFAGFSGVVTSQTSWPEVPKERSRYTLLRSARGSVLPLQTRAIWAPPCSPCARLSGDVGEIARALRIRHVQDRRPVGLDLPGQRIGHPAAVVADVRDVPIALTVDGRLVDAAGLQIAVADERHVALFRPVLGDDARAKTNASTATPKCQRVM